MPTIVFKPAVPLFSLRYLLAVAALMLVITPSQAAGIQTWTHRNVVVYHLPAKQLPIIDMRLWFRAGSAYNSDNTATAFLTNSIIGRGSKNLSKADLDLQLGLIGARFYQGIDRDGAWLDLRTLSNQLQPALALMTQIVSAPRWSDATLALLQDSNLKLIQRTQESDSGRLSLESVKLLYGDHPYAQPVSGTIEDNASVKLKSLQSFYRKHYTTKNMSLLVVGDIDKKQINAWLDDLSKKMPAGSALPSADWVKKTPLPVKKHIAVDSSQVHWNALSLGVSRTSTDFPLMALALFMLDKRLDLLLRDELGLTYSTGAYAHKLIGRGMIRIFFSTRAEAAAYAIEQALAANNRFFQRGVDEEELANAQRHLSGLLSISYNSNRSLLGLLQIIATEKLPVDYLPRLIARIQQTSAGEMNNFIHRYFSHRRFSTVSVGPENSPGDGEQP